MAPGRSPPLYASAACVAHWPRLAESGYGPNNPRRGQQSAERWVLAASAFFSGPAAGFLGAVRRHSPVASSDGGLELHGSVPSIRGAFLGKGVQLCLVARDVPRTDRRARAPLGRSRLHLVRVTAIGLGIMFVGVIIVSNVWKTPTYNVILAWGPRGQAGGLGGGTENELHDQLDPTRGDLDGVRALPRGPRLPLGDRDRGNAAPPAASE
jgi:hypothetical protein